MTKNRLELNLARVEQLAFLPGVGDQLARELVRHREVTGPFRSWTEVRGVAGMTDEALDVLMNATVLEPEDAAA